MPLLLVKGAKIFIFCATSPVVLNLKTVIHFSYRSLVPLGQQTLHKNTISPFPKCSKKIVFSKKLHWTLVFLVLSRKMVFRFFESTILFFRRKMKDDLSQKIYWKMIFSVCLVKIIFFSYKYDIIRLSKKLRWSSIFSRKNTRKDNISCIIEKCDIHTTKHGILLIEKLEMIKKFTFIKKFQWFYIVL